jgi:ribosomal protein S18 acetylase RimI-like enzyme
VLVAGTADVPALAGYAMIRDHGAPAAVGSAAPVELARLYTRPSLIGRGVGARLLAAAAEEARRRGFRSMWLGVWEHNHRAIAFYERHGFRDVGAHLFHLGTARQTDRLLVRPLDP